MGAGGRIGREPDGRARDVGAAGDARRARLEAIWAAVAAIPTGTVTSYGRVAANAGYPRAARLVGHALKVAPAGRQLPWHRVVGKGGRIALPPTSRHFREQRRRLIAEGLEVRRGRVLLPKPRGLDALLWGSDG